MSVKLEPVGFSSPTTQFTKLKEFHVSVLLSFRPPPPLSIRNFTSARARLSVRTTVSELPAELTWLQVLV